MGCGHQVCAKSMSCPISIFFMYHHPFIHVLALPSLNPCLWADHVLLCLCHGCDRVLLTWCPRSESTLHRYEVHPYGTFPVGPEFKTTLRVRNWRDLGMGRGRARSLFSFSSGT